MFRYWRVHYTNDSYYHWVNIDCGECVNETAAVGMAERAYPDRGPVTAAINDTTRGR